MKYLIVLFCGFVVAQGLPSYQYPIHPGVGAIYKGPGSETIIKGPDGSVITSEVEGGVVAVKGERPGAVIASGHFQPIVGPLGPIHGGQIIDGPLLGGPILGGPILDGPILDGGVIHAGPAHAGSIHAGPVHAGSIHAGPVQAGSIHAGPVRGGSIHTGPGLGGSIYAGPELHVAPALLPAPVILQDNPIIVPDVIDPKIVEEHVVVGNKIITVPKKLEENTDLIGPSGTISTRGGDAVISGPSSITVKGGGVVASIEKQPDINVKTYEVKPVVAPAVVSPIVVPKVILPAPVVETRVVTNYAPAAPILSNVHPIIPHGPIFAEPALTHSDLTLLAHGPANFIPHYAPAYTPFVKPIYRGGYH